ncbi:MAG: tetratricopeptide repeat protein [Candidatus Kerfeldbacteria bacterium]
MTPLLPRIMRSRPSALIGITKALLGAVVFLTPLFFIPGLNDIVELPKASLIVIIMLGAAFTWLLALVTGSDVRWRKVPGFWLLIVVVVAALLSALFSMNRIVSFTGTIGYVHHAFPVIASLVLFVILAVQVLDREEDVHQFVTVFIASLGIAGLLSLLQLSGLSPFGFPELRQPSFLPTGNSMASLATIMALVLPLDIMYLRSLRGRLWHIVVLSALTVATLLLLAIDNFAGWISLLVGIIVMISFVSIRRFTRLELALCIASLAIAVIGIVLPTGGLFRTDVTQDARLDASTSWSVTKETISKYPVIGSGTGTFFYDFVRYKPVDFARTSASSLRFLKASDEGLQILATMGVLGALSILALVGYLVYLVAVSSELVARKQQKSWSLVSSLVGAWCGITASFFFAPSTTVTFAAFWFLFALLLVTVSRSAPTMSITKPSARLGGVFTLVVVLAALIVVTTWSVRVVLADREMVRVGAAIRRTDDLSTITPMIDRSIRLNPWSALPYLLRAQSDLVQAQLIAQKGENLVQAQAFAARAIADGEAAVSHDPSNPVILVSLAEFYKSLSAIGGGSSELVLTAYERAVLIEPMNLDTRLSLGQAYYIIASSLTSEKDADQSQIKAYLSKARSEFTEALTIDPANIDSQFGLVLVDELSGEKDTAFASLEQLARDNPSFAPLWYQLGIRYLDRKDTARAKDAFQRAVSIDSTDVQSHWQLGLLAEQAKDYETARAEFTMVKELDPSNTDVQKKLDSLPAKK